MQKLILVSFLLITSITNAQFYTDFSVDPNKIFNVVDNPRTDVDHQGLDWDLEVGVATPYIGLYMFYGAFSEMDYGNYGVGLDYYLTRGGWYDISVGGQINFVSKPYEVYDENGDFAFYANYRGESIGLGARAVGVFWVFRNLGVSGRFQYITRGDLKDTLGIIEGSVGLRYKFD